MFFFTNLPSIYCEILLIYFVPYNNLSRRMTQCCLVTALLTLDDEARQLTLEMPSSLQRIMIFSCHIYLQSNVLVTNRHLSGCSSLTLAIEGSIIRDHIGTPLTWLKMCIR